MSLCIILPSKLRRVIPRVDSCLHILLIEYINLASFGITGWYGLVIVQRIQCWTNHNNKWAVSNTSSPTFHPLKIQKWKHRDEMERACSGSTEKQGPCLVCAIRAFCNPQISISTEERRHPFLQEEIEILSLDKNQFNFIRRQNTAYF